MWSGDGCGVLYHNSRVRERSEDGVRGLSFRSRVRMWLGDGCGVLYHNSRVRGSSEDGVYGLRYRPAPNVAWCPDNMAEFCPSGTNCMACPTQDDFGWFAVGAARVALAAWRSWRPPIRGTRGGAPHPRGLGWLAVSGGSHSVLLEWRQLRGAPHSRLVGWCPPLAGGSAGVP